MANRVLGKSLSSDWLFLGQDFAVRTVSMETVQSWKRSNPCIFVLEQSRQIQHLQPRQRKKSVKIVILHIEISSRTLKDWNFFETSKMNEEDEHFLNATHRKCILLSGTECHIINYLLTELPRAIPGNIGPRSFLYGPSAARSVLSRPGPIFPSTALALG